MSFNVKNKSKRIYGIRRRKTANSRKVDIDDPYLRQHHWKCPRCGDGMDSYKQDERGDLIMSCRNQFCLNSKDFTAPLSTRLAKLTKEMQMHSRYYIDYLGNYKAPYYNRLREYQYRPRVIAI